MISSNELPLLAICLCPADPELCWSYDPGAWLAAVAAWLARP